MDWQKNCFSFIITVGCKQHFMLFFLQSRYCHQCCIAIDVVWLKFCWEFHSVMLELL